MEHKLLEIISDRKKGIHSGIFSICSSNKFVIAAAMKKAKEENIELLLEVTPNQVNQYKGYSKMTPLDFINYIKELSIKNNFPFEKIIFGGDHLGPLIWKDETEVDAMEKAEELVKQFVRAGFTKLHIDTSMKLASDDKIDILALDVIVKRGLRLIEIAESIFDENKINEVRPVYVIGSEVPIPGGTSFGENTLVTKVKDFKNTIEAYNEAFEKLEMQDVQKRVIAIVVQPGVEFGNNSICEYDRVTAKDLTNSLKDFPNIIFEGHSTDYQTSQKLREMVSDGIAILKVGPALTFALREALFGLELIEKELCEDKSIHSNFSKVLENAMNENPKYWKSHYEAKDKKISMKYSFLDRSRYYLSDDKVNQSIVTLLENIDKVNIPLQLISQYFQVQYNKIRKGELSSQAKGIILDKISNVLDDYAHAIKPIVDGGIKC